MRMRLLGTRELDFITSNDNSQVKGLQLFVSYPTEGVVGEMTDKLFLREGFDFPPLKPGDVLDIAFNNKGKPESIKPISKQTT